jgi:hypothetical protein
MYRTQKQSFSNESSTLTYIIFALNKSARPLMELSNIVFESQNVVYSTINIIIIIRAKQYFIFGFIVLETTGFATRFQGSKRYVDHSLWAWDIEQNMK